MSSYYRLCRRRLAVAVPLTLAACWTMGISHGRRRDASSLLKPAGTKRRRPRVPDCRVARGALWVLERGICARDCRRGASYSGGIPGPQPTSSRARGTPGGRARAPQSHRAGGGWLMSGFPSDRPRREPRSLLSRWHSLCSEAEFGAGSTAPDGGGSVSCYIDERATTPHESDVVVRTIEQHP